MSTSRKLRVQRASGAGVEVVEAHHVTVPPPPKGSGALLPPGSSGSSSRLPAKLTAGVACTRLRDYVDDKTKDYMNRVTAVSDLLNELCELSSDQRATFVSTGGVTLTLALSRRYEADERSAAAGVQALGNLACDGPAGNVSAAFKKSVLDAGAIAYVLAAARRHDYCPFVAKAVAVTLHQLACADPKVARAGGVDTLLAIVRRYGSDPDIMTAAGVTLSDMASNDECKLLLVSAGAPMLLQNAYVLHRRIKGETRDALAAALTALGTVPAAGACGGCAVQ